MTSISINTKQKHNNFYDYSRISKYYAFGILITLACFMCDVFWKCEKQRNISQKEENPKSSKCSKVWSLYIATIAVATLHLSWLRCLPQRVARSPQQVARLNSRLGDLDWGFCEDRWNNRFCIGKSDQIYEVIQTNDLKTWKTVSMIQLQSNLWGNYALSKGSTKIPKQKLKHGK